MNVQRIRQVCFKLIKIRSFIPYLVISLFFFIFYSYLSLKIYDAHLTRGDLTSYAQAMWNTSQGRLMENTFNYSVHNFWGDRELVIPDESNIFGIHFNPILFLLLPLYNLFPDPKTLLIAQAFFVTQAGFVYALIAKRYIKSKILVLALELSFLLYLPLVSTVLSEFHAVSLSIFFGLLLIYFGLSRNNFIYLIFLILFLLIQENTAIIATFFGFYLLLFRRDLLKGSLTVLLGITYFFITIKILIPHLSLYSRYIFEGAYGTPLGSSFSEIIINSIKNPILFINTIITGVNLKYLSIVIFPIIPFIFFATPFLILVFLALLPNILSSSQNLKLVSMHYEALAVPFVFYSLIFALVRMLNLVNKKYRFVLTIVSTVLLLIFSFNQFQIFNYEKLNANLIFGNLKTEKDFILDNLISKIPKDASVSTQDYISGHLTNRQRLYLFPVYYDKVDFLLLANKDGIWPLTQEEHNEYINSLLKNQRYEVLHKDNHYLLIKRIDKTDND